MVERENGRPLRDADVAAHILRVLEQKGARVRLGASLEAIQAHRKVTAVTVAGENLPLTW